MIADREWLNVNANTIFIRCYTEKLLSLKLYHEFFVCHLLLNTGKGL
jgi:hypothetical protein